MSAAQANREFSKLLRAVQSGERVVVTSRGKPVAQISPAPEKDTETEQRQNEFREYLAELRKRPALNLPRLTREDFYD